MILLVVAVTLLAGGLWAARRRRNRPTGETLVITNAQESLTSEQRRRTRRYLISMGIRTGCVLAAIVTPGWPRWVLIAAAVTLPYLAVVIANEKPPSKTQPRNTNPVPETLTAISNHPHQ